MSHDETYTKNEQRLAFEDRAGYRPQTEREETTFRKITQRWEREGITPRSIRQAIRGFWTTYPQDPATPTRVDAEFSGFVALVTPRPPVSREDYGPRPGDVGPPVELVSRFLGSKESA